MKLIPCRHLDYDQEKYGRTCTLENCAPKFPQVRYWRRGEVWVDRDSSGKPRNPENVQFCGLGRGRINGIFQCYNLGEMPCYAPAEEQQAEEESHD